MIHHRCSNCGDDVMLSDGMLGKDYRCPSCGAVTQVGASPTQPGPPSQQPDPQTPPPPPEQQTQPPPPPDGAQGQYGQQPQTPPPYGQPQYGQQPYPPGYMPQAKPNAPGAVAALVCGILGMTCCFIFSIVAISKAGSAREAIAANPEYYGGEGLATAGRILGIIGLVLACIGILVKILGGLASL